VATFCARSASRVSSSKLSFRFIPLRCFYVWFLNCRKIWPCDNIEPIALPTNGVIAFVLQIVGCAHVRTGAAAHQRQKHDWWVDWRPSKAQRAGKNHETAESRSWVSW
jgi:hypothetical protein